MFFSDLQLENALCPIVRAELPPPSNVTVTSAEQLAKAFFFNGGHKIGDNEPRQADAAVESGSADRRDAGGNGIDARFSRRTIKDYVARLIAQHAVDRRIVRVFLVNVDLLKCGTPAENAQIEKFPRTGRNGYFHERGAHGKNSVIECQRLFFARSRLFKFDLDELFTA